MFLLIVLLSILKTWTTGQEVPFKQQKNYHVAKALNPNEIYTLANLSNLDHMNEVLDNICIERVVGTKGHEKVKNYIVNTMQDLGWTIEIDKFQDRAPIFGALNFTNVIAKLNPTASRYLTLACHYDSKYMKGIEFVGAIDSAVPCAQLINTAAVMSDQLQALKNEDVSLMFIFFDGEEAFKTWGPNDSIYGAKHLAKMWKQTPCLQHVGNNISELDKIDLLILLDLIGGSNPKFRNYSTNKKRWYDLLLKAEKDLATLGLFQISPWLQYHPNYFEDYSTTSYIEDDHIPFLKRNVPILHIIPYSFPENWHTAEDNRENLDLGTTENLNKILRLFIASYLHIKHNSDESSGPKWSELGPAFILSIAILNTQVL